MSTLNIFTTVVAYDDPTASSNPSRKHFDRAWKIQGVPATRPSSTQLTIRDDRPVTVFQGLRTLTMDEDTSFQVKSLGKSVYGLVHSGGPHPGFREDRGLDLTDIEVSVLPNNNQTVSIETPEATPFASVVYGDILNLGDEFSPLNQGEWLVISASPSLLTVKRAGQFEGEDEVVTLTSAASFEAFGAHGVQPGDKIELISGFSPASLKTFTVGDVTPDSIWFTSVTALPEETVAGVEFDVYSSAKKYLRLETTGELEITINGARAFRVSPIALSDTSRMGWFESSGPIHSLTIRSLEVSPITVDVLTCE